jgi:hypothetical protein
MHRPNERRDEIFDPRNERYDEKVFRESSPNIPPPAEEPAAPEFSEQIPPEPSAPPSDSPRSAAPPEVTEPPPKVEMQLQLRRVKKKPKTSKKLQNMMNDTEKFLEKGK